MLCIKLVNYWDKYTQMHGRQNVKKLLLLFKHTYQFSDVLPFCVYCGKLISQEHISHPISCCTLGSLSVSGTEHIWGGNELSVSEWPSCWARAGKIFAIMKITSRNPIGIPRTTVWYTVFQRIWTWSNCSFPTSPIISTVKETTWAVDGLTTRDKLVFILIGNKGRKRKR